MSLEILVIGGLVAGAGIGYLMYRRSQERVETERYVDEYISRRVREEDHKYVAPVSTKPANPWTPSSSRWVQPTPSSRWVQPSKPWKTRADLNQMERAEYKGDYYYRDRGGNYYYENGSPVMNMAIGAALGGLAGWAIANSVNRAHASAAASNGSYTPSTPYTPYDSSLDTIVPADFRAPAPAPSPVEFSRPVPRISEDRMEDAPSFQTERESRGSYRDEDSRPSYSPSTPSFSDESESRGSYTSSDSSYGGGFSSDSYSSSDTGGGFSSE